MWPDAEERREHMCLIFTAFVVVAILHAIVVSNGGNRPRFS